MGSRTDFKRLIEFAIKEEQKAQELYKTMSSKTKDPFAKAILDGLHEQETAHEEKLKSLLGTIHPS